MTTATTELARAFKGTSTEGRSEAELKELVRVAGAELELAPAEVIIEWAVATFGKKLRAHKVTSTGLDDYITNVVSAFLDQRGEDEAFATWVARADDDALRGEVGHRELEPVR